MSTCSPSFDPFDSFRHHETRISYDKKTSCETIQTPVVRNGIRMMTNSLVVCVVPKGTKVGISKFREEIQWVKMYYTSSVDFEKGLLFAFLHISRFYTFYVSCFQGLIPFFLSNPPEHSTPIHTLSPPLLCLFPFPFRLGLEKYLVLSLAEVITSGVYRGIYSR